MAKVIDGDTIDVDINGLVTRIRFALVNTQERGQAGYKEAKDFAALCHIGSTALVDPDNGQKLSFGRVVGVVYCYNDNNSNNNVKNYNNNSNDDNNNHKLINVNHALLQHNLAMAVISFCDVSEFSRKDWIKDQCNE